MLENKEDMIEIESGGDKPEINEKEIKDIEDEIEDDSVGLDNKFKQDTNVK